MLDVRRTSADIASGRVHSGPLREHRRTLAKDGEGWRKVDRAISLPLTQRSADEARARLMALTRMRSASNAVRYNDGYGIRIV